MLARNHKNIIRWAALVAFIVTLASCSFEKRDWEKAESENTIQAYETFLEKYPKSTFADTARLKIEELEFNEAESKNTIEAYEAFLKKYPAGEHASKARILTEVLYFKKAESENTLKTFEDFLQRFPDGSLIDNAYRKMQELYYGFSIEVLSNRIENKMSGVDGRWEVKDPAKYKGVVLSARLNLLPKTKKVNSGNFIIAYYSKGKKEQAVCSGLDMFATGQNEGGFWLFNKPESNKYWEMNLEEKKKAADISLIFAVPVDIDKFWFVYNGVKISKEIQIKATISQEKKKS